MGLITDPRYAPFIEAYPTDAFDTAGKIMQAVDHIEALGIEPTLPMLRVWLDGYWEGYTGESWQ